MCSECSALYPVKYLSCVSLSLAFELSQEFFVLIGGDAFSPEKVILD
ncbi:hypothetical protein BVRB_3g063980 [Beta vulgaris subsp. vulgaris]|nr:hypothetical protein BVRB_3g063980 [Beta vulgaris subsp. vulgaris]